MNEHEPQLSINLTHVDELFRRKVILSFCRTELEMKTRAAIFVVFYTEYSNEGLYASDDYAGSLVNGSEV